MPVPTAPAATDDEVRPFEAIPGPPARPLRGHMPEFRSDLLGWLSGLAGKYGDMARFRLWTIRCVLCSHPDLVEEVLVRRSGKTRKPWDVREMKAMLGDGLLTSEGELWREQRSLIQPAFHRSPVRSYGPIMVDRTREEVEGWTDGAVLDVNRRMMGVTLEIAAEALFGVDIGGHVDLIGRTLDVFQSQFIGNLTAPVPLPMWFPTPGNLRAWAARRRLDGVIYPLIEARRAEGAEGEDLLSRLIRRQAEADHEMSDRQLRDEVVTLLLAGHETTALALTWALHLLSESPEAEARLHAEVDEVCPDRDPTAADVDDLVWTGRVVKEAMRLYPPAWGVGREAAEDLVVGGHRIPAGTQLFVLQWVVHRDPRFYAEPEAFRPARWDPEEGEEIPRTAYFPFSMGPRTCVGMPFAELEATLVLATLARRVRLLRIPSERVEVWPAVTLRPRDGLRMRVRRRDGR